MIFSDRMVCWKRSYFLLMFIKLCLVWLAWEMWCQALRWKVRRLNWTRPEWSLAEPQDPNLLPFFPCSTLLNTSMVVSGTTNGLIVSLLLFAASEWFGMDTHSCLTARLFKFRPQASDREDRTSAFKWWLEISVRSNTLFVYFNQLIIFLTTILSIPLHSTTVCLAIMYWWLWSP